MEKQVEVHGTILREGDTVNSIYGRARLVYIGRQSFTNWTLLDERKGITVEDNHLDKFVIP